MRDRVLVICSDAYVKKADNDPHSGVGQERELMSLEFKNNNGTLKFIPVIRDNSQNRLPRCLGNRLWIDFNSDDNFDHNVQSLVIELKKGI